MSNAIFVEVCSKPKYQWLYNKLSANFEIAKLNDRNYEWMTECMEENFCKIKSTEMQKIQKHKIAKELENNA